MNKILLYSDTQVFGGHEIMSVEMANSLARQYKVCFVFFNEQIGDILNSKVDKIRIPVSSAFSFAGIRSFNPFHIFYLIRLFKKISPDLAIICQGSIEFCLKGVMASKCLNIKTVSYLPMAYSFQTMGIALGYIRDIINRFFYNYIDLFITVSKEQELLIRQNLAFSKDVYTLDNFTIVENNTIPPIVHYNGKRLRIGVIGNIKFKTKGQDRAVEIAKRLYKSGIDFEFVIVGAGHDSSKLVRLVNDSGLSERFVFKDWINGKNDIYSGLDIVLITSRFDAFPLTLLESILSNKIVFAPNKGIFKEYLPDSLLFADENGAADKIVEFLGRHDEAHDYIKDLKRIVMDKNSKACFEHKLFRIMEQLA